MITAAIVAEFNPLHNGHIFLIDEVRRELNADKVVVIMSGDYVQRGQPAIINKQFRSQMAIAAGADLVLLLPTVYSLSNADLFAFSSVSILDKLGCVDYLCFASECGQIEILDEIDEKLNNHSYEVEAQMKALLSQGMTYGKARSTLFPEFSQVLDKSNNILALEYIRALKSLNSSIKPFTIKRQGSDYNDTEISEGVNASASGIRELLSSKTPSEDVSLSILKSQLPSMAYDILSEQKKVCCPIDIDMFSSECYYSLLSKQEKLSEYLDISDSLANKIRKHLSDFESISSFIEILKSKEVTYSRISRSIMHLLLNIKNDNDFYRNGLDKFSHIRILGISKDAPELMKEIATQGRVSLITSIPKVYDEFNDFERLIYDQDLFASTLYDHIVFKEFGSKAIHEYSKKYI